MTSALRRSQPASLRLTASPRPCPAKTSLRSVSAAVGERLIFRVQTKRNPRGQRPRLQLPLVGGERVGVGADQEAGEGIPRVEPGTRGRREIERAITRRQAYRRP